MSEKEVSDWVRIDVLMPWNRKMRPLSDAAFRVQVKAVCWCKLHRTDGVITKVEMVEDVLPPGKRGERVLKELLDAELLESVNGHYEVHDYLDWQESREDRERARAQWRQRKRRQREREKGDDE